MGQSLSPLRVVPYSRITGFVIVVNRLADFLSGCFLPVLHEFDKSGWSMLTLLMQRGHECVEINRSGLWQLLHRGRRWTLDVPSPGSLSEACGVSRDLSPASRRMTSWIWRNLSV